MLCVLALRALMHWAHSCTLMWNSWLRSKITNAMLNQQQPTTASFSHQLASITSLGAVKQIGFCWQGNATHKPATVAGLEEITKTRHDSSTVHWSYFPFLMLGGKGNGPSFPLGDSFFALLQGLRLQGYGCYNAPTHQFCVQLSIVLLCCNFNISYLVPQ